MRRRTEARGWNHNIHYHGFVLDLLPAGCRRALDVGCGEGSLARKLARHCDEVVAIDSDAAALARARERSAGGSRIVLHHGDVLARELPDASFDFIAVVATLHHLPLESALIRFRDLLRSGGTLAVVGLYKLNTPMDYLMAALAAPLSWIIRHRLDEAEVGAPLMAPKQTLQEIRRAATALLPGARLRRRLFFRYTLAWRKP